MPYTFRPDFFSAADIAASGQCFRMTPAGDRTWVLIAHGERLYITQEPDGLVTLSCTEDEYNLTWRDYFDMNTDYGAAIAAIPEEDGFLRTAAEASSGVRLLRQDPWEMLITFIISQRKSIPAIRTSVERLCALCGEDRGGWYAFPHPEAVAALTTDELLSCGVGYRARYIKETARMCLERDLGALAALDDDALQSALTAFPGVGVKVAQCVMLFGYHRQHAAPVDVWINRVIDEHYGGVNPFARYGEYAGLYQQYLFYYRQNVMRQK